jgi:hypothetical protein
MDSSPTSNRKSEFLDSLQKGLLLGAALLALLLPPAMHREPAPPAPVAPPAPQYTPHRLADFGSIVPTPDVRQVANWAVYTHDYQNRNFIIVDKKDARVYVFDREGRLQSVAPVLLGSAIGDDTVPGIGDKPIAQVRPEERTTPAGRFVAEIGMNMRGEDVVWVDYDAAVSMHRVLTTNPSEHRLERLASPTNEDNRISYGCINLPRAFYENVVGPTVRTGGAIIYVLPETRTPQQVFGSYDVPRLMTVAQH